MLNIDSDFVGGSVFPQNNIDLLVELWTKENDKRIITNKMHKSKHENQLNML